MKAVSQLSNGFVLQKKKKIHINADITKSPSVVRINFYDILMRVVGNLNLMQKKLEAAEMLFVEERAQMPHTSKARNTRRTRCTTRAGMHNEHYPDFRH